MTFTTLGSWFSYENHAAQPRANVTTSDQDADDGNTSPVAHVLDSFTYRQWQSPSKNDWFQIDFKADVSIQNLCVVFPRITNPYQKHETQEILPTDTIRHYLDADGGTPGLGAVLDTGVVNCGALPTRGYSVFALASPVTCRYWRCAIDAISRESDGFFLVSYAYAGPIFQPAWTHIYGDKIGLSDPSEIQRTPAGQVAFTSRNARILKASANWDFIPDAERRQWEAMAEYAGNTLPVLFSRLSDGAAPFSSLAGPDGQVIEGDRVMLGLNGDDLSTVSRQLDANIRQIQMTEHR